MNIKAGLAGAGTAVLLIGGVFGAALIANADSPEPVVTIAPTVEAEKVAAPDVTPEPEPVAPAPVVEPAPAPAVVEPAPEPEVVVPENEPDPQPEPQPEQVLPTAATFDPVTGAGNGDPANADSRP